MEYLVVPTVFSLDSNTFKRKVEMLKSFCTYVHIDVCDGKFVPTKTFLLSSQIDFFHASSMNCEVHLMVEKPLEYLDLLRKYSAKIIYLHVEILSSREELEYFISSFSKIGAKVGLVFNPKTSVDDYLHFLSLVDNVMLMSVIPGAEGQKFDSKVLSKVRDIKILKPSMVVQIDGGISVETGKLALESGVDRLAVGSFITSSENPQEHYEILVDLAKK